MTEEEKMLGILNRLNIEYKQTKDNNNNNKLYTITFDNPYHPLSAYFDKNGNCTDLTID